MSTVDRKLKVFLCHAKEDKPTVRDLYRQLTAEGWMDVWLDEIKLLPGQEWDIEIEKAVEQADVVIVCLSNKSVDKEGYVQKELRFVLNIADEKTEGTIFVVPLRLYNCAVPRRIRAWQYVDYFPKNNQAWAYQRLIESLKLRSEELGISIKTAQIPALETLPRPTLSANISRLELPVSTNEDTIFTIGGTVQAGGGIYLSRPADDELFKCCQSGNFSYVLTARQMGKSSLMVRTAERLNSADVRTVIIDLTTLGTHLDSDKWYLGFVEILVEQLNLSMNHTDWWNRHAYLENTQRLSRFFLEAVLEANTPLVVFVDEIDTTLSLPFSDDFFAVIRSCYNARGKDPIYKRLAFVLLGVATPGDLIRDPMRTPFNIGIRIDLTDFTLEQALPLADGLNLSRENAFETLKWVLAWTGGHPYLTQRLCQSLVERNRNKWEQVSVAQVVAETFFGEKSKPDGNLQFVSDMLTHRAPKQYAFEVMQNLLKIESGQIIKYDERSIPKKHLELVGVVRQENDYLILRNKIYAKVFNQRWIMENMPISWKQRRILAMIIIVLVVLLIGVSLFYKYYGG